MLSTGLTFDKVNSKTVTGMKQKITNNKVGHTCRIVYIFDSTHPLYSKYPL